MTLPLAMVLGLLAAAIVMFAINRPRMDAVALIMLTALPLTGVLSMSEALAGFSDSNIVLIAALFVIGDGLVRTGVARKLGDLLIQKSGSSETRLMVLLMLAVCGLGSFMSSTAVTAIFIPVALRISQSTGTSPSQLMMPLSVAALISGMMTLVATAPNLVVNSELVRQGAAGFHFFSFTPFGLPILFLAIVYMYFARRWLSAETSRPTGQPTRPTIREWIEEYHLAEREYRVRILATSQFVDRTIDELQSLASTGARIVAIERRRGNTTDLIQPTPKTELHRDDVLLIDLYEPTDNIAELRERYGLEELPLSGGYFSDRSQEIGMVEVIIPTTSELVGKTITGAGIRTRYGLTVIGLKRGPHALDQGLLNEVLKVGDTLLMIGSWKAISNIQLGGRNLVILSLPIEIEEVLPVPGKASQSLFCLGLMVVLMVSGVVPNVQAALIACLLMGALRIIDLESAYRSIDWKTIVLIVGMLPFSVALQRTGGVELASNALMTSIGGAGHLVVLAVIFGMTALLGMFISNTATAVLMAPVALAVAKELGVSPYPLAMIVALGASTAFMTPVSSPVNTLVVTPGNYTFGDFLRVGIPFAIIVMIVSVLLVPIVLPL